MSHKRAGKIPSNVRALMRTRQQLHADADRTQSESHSERSVKLFSAYCTGQSAKNPQGNLINKQERIIQGLNT